MRLYLVEAMLCFQAEHTTNCLQPSLYVYSYSGRDLSICIPSVIKAKFWRAYDVAQRIDE